MESNGNYPTLELIVEYAVAHSYVLAPGKHQIGRIENAEIKLVDTSVSARHAELQVVPSTDFPGYFTALLTDQGSKNGTKINGARISNQELQHGDMVTIGRSQLRYVDPGRFDVTQTGVLLSD